MCVLCGPYYNGLSLIQCTTVIITMAHDHEAVAFTSKTGLEMRHPDVGYLNTFDGNISANFSKKPEKVLSMPGR